MKVVSNINNKMKIAIDYSQVKDSFDTLKYKITQNLSKMETLIEERDKLKNEIDPNKIRKKINFENSINSYINETQSLLKQMKVELKSLQKKKAKDVDKKEQLLNLLFERFNYIDEKNRGIKCNDNIYEQTKNKFEELDQILEKRKNIQQNNIPLSTEEENAINEKVNEWKNEVNEQDKKLDLIGEGVKQIGREAQIASGKIDHIGKHVRKLNKHIDKTNKRLADSTDKLKDLLNKIRSGDKCCVTLICLLILFGLIAALYNIVKRKWF